MPKIYVRKTNRGVSQEVMDKAINKIMDKNCSVRSAAKEFGISPSTLQLYYNKIMDPALTIPPKVGYRSPNRVFSDDQEVELENYLIQASEIYFGLNPFELRKLAYQIAKMKSLKIPKTWEDSQLAGLEWYKSFMSRHKKLSLRKPQATSLTRATSFNKSNVELFFENLRKVFAKNNFEARSIYNMDETGVTTVHHPTRIIASRGAHQVGALTSGERGTLITVAIAVNAIGNSIPPHFIFPRIRFRDHFIHNGPVGSIGSGNKSGWMQDKDFLLFIQHFAKYSGATSENKVLLLFDNHDSHISVQVIDFCRENGIVLLSLPPHCSHKLQPLDRTIYGPFKKHFNKLSDAWMKNNPGKTMTIYDLPGLVKDALIPALSISNITNGFKCTGIYPFNANIFSEADFSPSFVSDRPEQAVNEPVLQIQENRLELQIQQNEPEEFQARSLYVEPTSSLSHWDFMLPDSVSGSLDNRQTSNLNLQENFPFPKSGPRKINTRGRKRRKSAILTNSPERNAILAEKASKVSKKKPKVAQSEANATPIKKSKKAPPKKIFA